VIPTAAALDLRRVGRDGRLALGFERRGAATVLARCRSTVPLQVLVPVELGGPAAVVSILNPTGGLVGGDRLGIDVCVGPGAHACLTTPSATRVYRTAGPPAEQEIRLALAPGAVVEWVPDHTIPYAGSAFRQRIQVELGAGARAVLVDAFAAGRVARGEAWRFSLLDATLEVRDAGGWVFRDRVVLRDGGPWAAPGHAEGRPYVGSVVLAGDADHERFAAAASAALRDIPGVLWGVGALARGGAVVRLLADRAPALLDAVEAVWRAARWEALGLPPLLLRKP
jgi:urease accessory protein